MAAASPDTPLQIGPQDADAAIIMLHGLGADGRDLAGLVDHLPKPDGARWRWLFPDAPVRPVTLNGGVPMRAWYDIDPNAGADAAMADIEASAASAAQLIDAQMAAGISASRIVLGGFSQGGVIALHQGLRHNERLAGIVALSTYLHASASDAAPSLANADVPIFMAHGAADPMIPLARGAQARDDLEGLGYPVSWHQYPMGHEVCIEELRDLGGWLAARLTH